MATRVNVGLNRVVRIKGRRKRIEHKNVALTVSAKWGAEDFHQAVMSLIYADQQNAGWSLSGYAFVGRV